MNGYWPTPMPWWLDLVLLAVALLFWARGSCAIDDTWGLFQKMLAAAALAVVLLGGRQMLLEVAGVLLALWLPSAARIEGRGGDF
jgi:hypothetical protein